MKCFVYLLHSFADSLPQTRDRLVLLVEVDEETLLVILLKRRLDVPRALLQVALLVQLNVDLPSVPFLGLRKQGLLVEKLLRVVAPI